MNTQTNTHKLEIKRVFNTSPARIYRAWTKTDEIKAWHCPEGLTVAEASTDGIVGGRFRIVMQEPEGEQHIAYGQYTEMIPYEKLVFSWAWEVAEGEEPISTTVTVLLKPIDDTRTELTLIHEGFEEIENRDGHNDGWSSGLNRLAAHVEN